MQGKGNLTLTGHLGDVMRESAQIAYSYVRAQASELGIDQELVHQLRFSRARPCRGYS
jgi:ATP-dependent Lon protease